MKKIIIWGTGMEARRLCHYLNFNEVEIIGFTDNSAALCKKLWNGYKYISKWNISKYTYDYIVITNDAQSIEKFINHLIPVHLRRKQYHKITEKLLSKGINRERLIQAGNVQFMIPNTLYFFDQIEEDTEKYKIFTDINSFSLTRW